MEAYDDTTILLMVCEGFSTGWRRRGARIIR
jgi:hypothetical protein